VFEWCDQPLIAITYLLAATLIGFVSERVFLVWLRAVFARSRLRGLDAVISAAKGFATELGFVVGVRLAADVCDLPVQVEGTVQDLVFVALVTVVTIVIARLTVALLKSYMTREDGVLPATSILMNVARAVVFIIGMLIVLQYFEISIAPILTALGVGGLAVALALQDTLSNLFSGLQILASKQFGVGDYIQLDSGQEGYIQDITWRNTIIQAISNNEIVVPNTKLANAILVNFQRPEPGMSLIIEGGVSYASDLEHVERTIIDEAHKLLVEREEAVGDFEPLVRFHSFDDSSIGFKAILRVRRFSDQYVLKHEFIKRLHRRFGEEGIEIPFPIRTVLLRQSTETDGS